jgi:hypothetical protein
MRNVMSAIGTLQKGVEGLKDEVRILGTRVGGLEVKFEEFGEELSAVARAVDRDAVTLIDHERRITRLEKTEGA